MSYANALTRRESERYRKMAAEIRSLIPKLTHSEAAMDLRVLAVRYERLAARRTIDRVAGFEYRLQAG